MFERDTSAQEVMNLITENEEATLLQKAAEVPECLRKTPVPTWKFTGQYAMPYSEHLIPFRN